MSVRELVELREFPVSSIVVSIPVVIIAAVEVIVVAAGAVVIAPGEVIVALSIVVVAAGEVVLVAAHRVVVSCILMTVKAILLPHEGIWVFPYFFANSRVLLQVGLQRRMLLHKVLVVYERGVLAKLLGDFAMVVHELVKLRQFFGRCIAVAPVVSTIEAIHFLHGRDGVLRYLLPNSRLILHERLQLRMLLHKVPVVYQCGVLVKLLGNFAMAVQELIELRQLHESCVADLCGFTGLSRRGLRMRGSAKTERKCQSEQQSQQFL